MFTIDSKTLSTRAEYDKYIIDNAESFTVICRLGKGRLKRRHYKKRKQAEKMAQQFANKYCRVYILYATYKDKGCHVANFHPE